MNTLKQKLMEYIDEQHLIEMTSDMIALPSHEGIPQQETGVARYIKGIFDANGIPCQLIEVEQGRCNVIARLDGKQPGPAIMLNGHMDTVKPDNMPDALIPKLQNGLLYGRGASDMKGPIASMIEGMLAVKKADLLEKGTILFTGVLDEEHGSIGTIDLLESGLRADAAIVGEPTELSICTAHRGLEWLKFHFIGKTVHGGAQKNGVNAISKAVDFINEMEATLIPQVTSRKHPLLEEATINYGVIHGGTQLSTVAGQCNLYVDRRFLPYEIYDDVMAEFQAVLDRLSEKDPAFKCQMEVMEESQMKEGYVHMPMEIEPEHPLTMSVKKAAREATEEEPVMSFFPAWTDGGLLKSYGDIPTVVLGPGLIECCHSEAEYIPVDHLPKAALIYALAALDFCSGQNEKVNVPPKRTQKGEGADR